MRHVVLRPRSVARAVLIAVTAPPDADVTELSIRRRQDVDRLAWGAAWEAGR